jgi:leucyl-tRNA synthetase
MGQTYFVNFAYPTSSGYLSVGHAYSYTWPDVNARLHRALGHEVFFPTGFHDSGANAHRIFDEIKKDPENSVQYGIPTDDALRMQRPEDLLDVFHESMVRAYRRMNYSLDYDTLVNTTDPGYQRFIQWQMRRLKDKSLIVQKPYNVPWCQRCGPRSVEASSTDTFGISADDMKRLRRFIEKHRLDVNEAIELELPVAVKCRCGYEPLILRRVDKQWFVDYANNEWKEQGIGALDRLQTYPRRYRKSLPGIINWLEERPLTRSYGFGTPFPYDERYIVDPLADSTVYMAYFVISPHVNRGEIAPPQLNDSVFDYIFMGKGDVDQVAKNTTIDKELLIQLRNEFLTVYPVDLNCAGKEHASSHLPFFWLHHVALFPEDLWPKGIYMHGHVLDKEGHKMSKSEGNIVALDDALERYGTDVLRLYLLWQQDYENDLLWHDADIRNIENHLRRYEETVRHAMAEAGDGLSGQEDVLNSKIRRHIERAASYAKRLKLRGVVTESFFAVNRSLREYLNQGGHNEDVLTDSLLAQLQMLYPFVPQTADRICREYLHKDLKHEWPGI